MDIWNIIDGFEEARPCDADPKVLKEYQSRVKKVMSIIGLNLTHNQLAHIKSCTRSAKVSNTFCNIYEKNNLSNILFIVTSFLCEDAIGRRLVEPHQQGQGIRRSTRLFGGTGEKWRHFHDLVREFANIVQILEYCLGDYVDEGAYDELHDNIFYARNMESQGEEVPKWGCSHNVPTKQRWQFIFRAKTLNRASIMTNYASLYVFGTKPRTSSKKMWRMQRTMMTIHL